MTVLSNFWLVFKADTDSASKGIEKLMDYSDLAAKEQENLEHVVDKTTKKIELQTSAVNDYGGIISKAFKTLAAFGTGYLVAGGIDNAASSVRGLKKEADGLQISIGVLDNWKNAVELAGGSAEVTAGALERVQKTMQAAQFDKKSEAFRLMDLMGIDLVDAEGQARKTTDILLELSEKLEGKTQKQKQLAYDIFGIEKEIQAVIGSSLADTQKLLKESEGRSITDEMGKDAEEFNKNSILFQQNMQDIYDRINFWLMPKLVELSKIIGMVFDAMQGDTEPFFTWLDQFGAVGETVKGLFKDAMELYEDLKAIFSGDEDKLQEWLDPLGIKIEELKSVGKELDGIFKILGENGVEILKRAWPIIRDIVKYLLQFVKEALPIVGQLLLALLPVVGDTLITASEAILTMVKALAGDEDETPEIKVSSAQPEQETESGSWIGNTARSAAKTVGSIYDFFAGDDVDEHDKAPHLPNLAKGELEYGIQTNRPSKFHTMIARGDETLERYRNDLINKESEELKKQTQAQRLQMELRNMAVRKSREILGGDSSDGNSIKVAKENIRKEQEQLKLDIKRLEELKAKREKLDIEANTPFKSYFSTGQDNMRVPSIELGDMPDRVDMKMYMLDVDKRMREVEEFPLNSVPLGQVSEEVSALEQNQTRANTVNIQSITVETQATDADGIANDIGGSLQGTLDRALNNYDDGVVA